MNNVGAGWLSSGYQWHRCNRPIEFPAEAMVNDVTFELIFYRQGEAECREVDQQMVNDRTQMTDWKKPRLIRNRRISERIKDPNYSIYQISLSHRFQLVPIKLRGMMHITWASHYSIQTSQQDSIVWVSRRFRDQTVRNYSKIHRFIKCFQTNFNIHGQQNRVGRNHEVVETWWINSDITKSIKCSFFFLYHFSKKKREMKWKM